MKNTSAYQALSDRNLKNVQMEHLARRFDFGKESRISYLIIQKVNNVMDELEEKLGIVRVQPFELKVRFKKKDVLLPLLKPQYIKSIVRGKHKPGEVLQLIQKECLDLLQEVDQKARKIDLLKFINIRSVAKYRKNGGFRMFLANELSEFDENISKYWRSKMDSIRVFPRADSLTPIDICCHKPTREKLINFAQYEVGLGPKVSRQLVEEIIILRNLFCPLASQISYGQMPVIATHVKAYLSLESATRYRRLAPLIITVFIQEEKKRLEKDKYSPKTVMQILKERIVRATVEAYRQNGLLTLVDMEWIFNMSSTRIGEIIRSFHKETNVILPTPGTILDAGRSMTHKDIIVNLYLQGYNVKQISKMTYHSPRAVDNYIGTFDAVLICYIYKIPIPMISFILKKGCSVIVEYIDLAKKYLVSRKDIINHLNKQQLSECSII